MENVQENIRDTMLRSLAGNGRVAEIHHASHHP